MPQRETVAGEATARSWTSKSIRIFLLSLIRSPLARQSVMLSSSTVFMFSIQMASTGHRTRPLFLHRLVSVTALPDQGGSQAVSPLPVPKLYSPYSSPILMHLGLNMWCLITWNESLGWPSLRSFVIADLRIW